MSTHHGILLHVVFSTKYRFKCISQEWSDDLYAYMGGTVREHDAVLLTSGGTEDHVHLLMKVSPKYAISSTVQLLKANASRWVNENRKVAAKFSWQRGYGAFSVSESMAENVRRYIKSQREHHQRQTFQDEYLELLRRHQIEFDPKFVFEQEVIA
jgi:putative transposase